MELKESKLFLPLKKYFNSIGYKVYAEVPNKYRCIDFVAVKDEEQIAVEMKTRFNREVVFQAYTNSNYFKKSYIAIPVCNPKEDNQNVMACLIYGIGVLMVGDGYIFEYMEAREQNHNSPNYDFSVFQELDSDEAGLPYQKGRSEAKVDIERIKAYLHKNPHASLTEIYENIQTHYSNKYSMKNTLLRWQGFNIEEYRNDVLKGGIY